jgi:hypothetical protein
MSLPAAWRWALRVAAVAGAVPLLLSSHLPCADLPEHVAVMSTLRAWNDAAHPARLQYTIAGLWRTPYVLYHLLGAALTYPFGGAERAHLFLLLLTAIAYPHALRSLLRALGRDERLAVVGVAAFWTRPLAEGLMPYVASVPVAVWGLALAVRQAGDPRPRRAVGLVALALATLYLHLSAFVVLMAGALLASLLISDEDAPRPTVRQRLVRSAWMAVPLLVAVATIAPGLLLWPDRRWGPEGGFVLFPAPVRRLHELWGWLFDFWRSPGDDLAGALLVAALLLAVVRPATDGHDRRGRRVGAALLAVVATIYLLGPSQVSFAFLLDLRMAPFLLMFVATLAPGRRDRRADLAALLATLAVLASCAHAAVQMRAWERDEAAHFDAVLRRLRPGRRLVMLVFQRRSERVVVTPFLHFGAYYRIRYGGLASFSFAELPHWPVRYRPEVAPPRKHYTFWDWAPCLYRNTVDGPAYDYALVRGEDDPFRAAPGPVWQVIGGAREWTLYERTDRTTPGRREDDRGPCRR